MRACARRAAGSRWASLRVGDALASIDGAPSFVSGVFPQGERQVYRVTFSDGRSCECCAEHLWRVHYRDWPAPRVLRTDAGRRDAVAASATATGSGSTCRAAISASRASCRSIRGCSARCSATATSRESTIRFSTAVDAMRQRLRATHRCDAASSRMPAASIGESCSASAVTSRAFAACTTNPLTPAIRRSGCGDCAATTNSSRAPSSTRRARTARSAARPARYGRLGRAHAGRFGFATSSRRLADDVVELVRSLGGWCSVACEAIRFLA